MSSSNNPSITLELDAGGDPIRGTIDRGDGSRLCFWGWLELMEELRRVAAVEPSPPPAQPSRANNKQPSDRSGAERREPHAPTEE